MTSAAGGGSRPGAGRPAKEPLSPRRSRGAQSLAVNWFSEAMTPDTRVRADLDLRVEADRRRGHPRPQAEARRAKARDFSTAPSAPRPPPSTPGVGSRSAPDRLTTWKLPGGRSYRSSSCARTSSSRARRIDAVERGGGRPRAPAPDRRGHAHRLCRGQPRSSTDTRAGGIEASTRRPAHPILPIPDDYQKYPPDRGSDAAPAPGRVDGPYAIAMGPR